MPNYKSSFLWFPNIAAMSSFLLDSTDEDGLVFAVGVDATNWKLATWRKNSTEAVDNTRIYSANGPGRWVILETATLPPLAFAWNSSDANAWNSSNLTDWNSDVVSN